MPATAVSRIRVRYAETDAMKVVHHAVWPVYWEIGRTDLLRERVKAYSELEREGIRFPVIDFGVKLLTPAHYDDSLEIITRVAEIGRVRLRFEYEGWRGDEILARGFSSHGVVDRSWNVIRIPTQIAVKLGED
ncbi:MAG: acyl-CoA thioesterase [bacterium]|nr:acyl-CoA thioesterase [bacterium]